ncbi:MULTISPECIES: 3-hydroxyisobutyrate dehydrogenase [unclassified Chelatococcus]|uniref:3-hydroxyisobutyrate dehydrogenase n=1 Tax=unclassified Chelatococcus TaxID=2638111 RepID=UPI001BCFBD06|nr:MULTISPECIES: 3-hydroxyisobutyrate dehydrogenase [unclassified Chelatococcus]MBS7700941.1 3-hydroxyisobutyrate dehydrogenase [Chelatococcus sp. YT9]MBX3555474.1 3-hydroxyisobutyrate dehydrogenase [Chelatococcus sp.]
MHSIAFIGLGNMGAPMALNLVKAGHDVRGYDLLPANCEAVRAGGVAIAESAPEAADTAEIVITMLPAGKHVLAVWNDVLAKRDPGKPGPLLIDCSTIDVASSRQAHERGQAAGCLTLDAPVSGGTVGAAAATLTFMCGGSAEAFAAAEPVLATMGRRVVHCGPNGNGQAAKICNNMILGISMIGVSEAFVLGEKLGLSPQALYDVASVSSGQCWALTTNCPVPGPLPTSPANRGYKPGFATALMLKDLTLAQEAAAAVHAATPLGLEAAALYNTFAAQGHGNLDFSAIIEFLRRRSGDTSTPGSSGVAP